jgi:glycolate oxidase iron-sulfur subunit
MIKEYGHVLRNDAAYAEKARRIAELTRDLAEVVPALTEALTARLQRNTTDERIVFHPPCTLQHGQKIRGVVENMLRALGAEVAPVNESHLCCGSAGTYSVLQPELAYRLRDRKLNNLQAPEPAVILSANVGCITHLQSGTTTRVEHWIEWLDRRLANG